MGTLLSLKYSYASISPMAVDKDNQLYEVAYLINPAYAEEEVWAFQQALKNHVQSLGGLIDHEGEVIKRRLFYPIQKMAEAYLSSFRLLLAPEKTVELKAKLNSKEVLRFLLVQTKRQPVRTYRQRITKIAGVEMLATQAESKIKLEQTMPKFVEPKQDNKVQPASNIEEIDKKLEEILGK